VKDDAFPKRLIDSAPDELTRELLEAASAETPPAERASVWLTAAASASGTGGGATPAASGAHATWYTGKLLKGVLSILAVGALGVAVVHVVVSRPAAKEAHTAPSVIELVPPAPVAPSAAAPEPSPAAIAVTDLPLAPPPPPVGAARGKPAPQAEPSAEVPSLGPQLERLREARALLQRGDANGAVSAVADYERAFPSGAFWPEAEAIAIDALVASGRSAEARARARAFLRNYGDSPQASRFTTIAGM
jgi:hypothetical protein